MLRLIHGYMVAFQLGLLPLLLYLNGQPAVLSIEAMAPSGLGQPTTLICYGAGILSFLAAFMLPRLLLNRPMPVKVPGVGSQHVLGRVMAPYLSRLCFLETCALSGFVLAFMQSSPYAILPFLIISLVTTILSAPTPNFLARFFGG